MSRFDIITLGALATQLISSNTAKVIYLDSPSIRYKCKFYVAW